MSVTADPDSLRGARGDQTATKADARGRTRVRDPRLDFFRGIAMFIILIAHTPGNFLGLWIPARFGFSDATEIFVFCSGMASAIAFASIYRTRGWWLGTVRTLFRVWQVYWAHIGIFLVTCTFMVALTRTGLFETDYVAKLNLYPFIFDPGPQLVGLMTLTYVPNYFDILPMYIVILALMPVVIALRRIGVWAAASLIVGLWLGANLLGWSLPAEPWSDREWFFNPFGWALVFYTGFFLMAGWLPRPPVDRRLVWLCLAIVLLIVPLAYFRIYLEVEPLLEWRRENRPWFQKTDMGPLRFLHFIALAYLAWIAAGPVTPRIGRGTGLAGAIWGPILSVILKVGQQSLAVFAVSMVLARLLGVLIDVIDGSRWSVLAVNLLGFAILIGVAYFVAWIKGQPWRAPRPTVP